MTKQKSTILDTFDVIRLRNVTNLSTTELLTRELISFHFGPNTGLPVCNIELLNWNNRAADLQRFLAETKNYQSKDVSTNFGGLIDKLIKSGFFIPTKRNDRKKAVLKKGSKVFSILGNIMYNFDSFNYFSNDERVLKTINDPKVTQSDFMYIANKIDALVLHLIKLHKKYKGDDDTIMQFINKIPAKEVKI